MSEFRSSKFDEIASRIKDVVGNAEGHVDAGKLRQWVDDVDKDKLKSWLDEAKSIGAGAASVVEEQGEKLVERAPGTFDRIAGIAKEKLGSLTGDEGPMNEGQIERLKGQIKETIASVTEMVESEVAGPGDTQKSKRDKGSES